MPNGKPGDHPVTDMLLHKAHPFPPDIEGMLRMLHDIDPGIVNDLEWAPSDWAEGKNLVEARARLRALLIKHGVNPDTLKPRS